MNSILQVFYSIFSGLMLSAAVPNELLHFGSPVLAFFAIIPYYYAIKHCKSYKQAFFCGFCQTLTTHLCSSFWLANFKDFAILTLGGTAIGTAFLGGFFGLYFYLPHATHHDEQIKHFQFHKKFFDTPWFRIIYFACMYTIFEWCKSCGFLGYPWATISTTMFLFPQFMQIADITGIYGLTILTIAFSGILEEGWEYHKDLMYIQGTENKINHFYDLKNITITYLIFMAVTLIYGNYQYSKTRTPTKTVTSVIVQMNSDSWIPTNDDYNIPTSQKLTREKIQELENQGKQPQLVIWSEGTLVYPFPTGKSHYKHNPSGDALIPFIEEIQTPLVTGGSYFTSFDYNDETYNKYYNTALVFDKDGKYRGYYAKLHLVPFAEALPGGDIPQVRELLMKIVGISSGWSKGEQLNYFEIPCSWYSEPVKSVTDTVNLSIPEDVYNQYVQNVPTVKISTPICFDDAFPDVIRPMFNFGAELFVNITDDSWSLKASSEYQHFVTAAYRAIEYRTTLVRSTNAGYSVVVDPAGKVLMDMPLFQQDAKAFDIPVYEHIPTIYSKLGNWLPYFCVVLFILFWIYSQKTFQKTDFIPSERKNKNLKSKHKKNKHHKK